MNSNIISVLECTYQWTHQLFEEIGVMMIFFFFLPYPDTSKYSPRAHRDLTYTFVLLFYYFNLNSTFSVKKKNLFVQHKSINARLFSPKHLSSPQSSLPSFTMSALSSFRRTNQRCQVARWRQRRKQVVAWRVWVCGDRRGGGCGFVEISVCGGHCICV